MYALKCFYKEPKYIRYLNVDKYVGVKSSAEITAMAQTEKAINASKQRQLSAAQQAQALTNQTGGNILGFTYE